MVSLEQRYPQKIPSNPTDDGQDSVPIQVLESNAKSVLNPDTATATTTTTTTTTKSKTTTTTSSSSSTAATERVRPLSSLYEIQRSHSQNYIEWGRGGLSLKNYLKREQHLCNQTISRGGNSKYWTYEVFVPNQTSSDPTDGKWVSVSCCESLTRPALYKVAGKPVRTTVIHAIGAVFTPAEYRGKGYAKKLVDYVSKMFDQRHGVFGPLYDQLESDLDFQNSSSALWSDVGRYYEFFGYKKSSNMELVIHLPKEHSQNNDRGEHVSWLTEDDVRKLGELDTRQFTRALDYLVEQDGVPRTAITPSWEVHEMTHARAHFVAPLLRRDQVASGVGLDRDALVGVDSDSLDYVSSSSSSSSGSESEPLTDDESEEQLIGKVDKKGLGAQKVKSVKYFGAKSGPVSMIWSQDIGNNKLNVLRVVVDDEYIKQNESQDGSQIKQQVLAHFDKLLKAATEDAMLWKLSKITMWEQDVPRVIRTEGPRKGEIFVDISLDDVAESWNQYNQEHGLGLEAHPEERADSWPMARPMNGRKEGWNKSEQEEQTQVLVFDGKYAWFWWWLLLKELYIGGKWFEFIITITIIILFIITFDK